VSYDPLALSVEVDRATERLLATVARLTDEELASASLLPAWSRGHVLSHVARNADGLVNLLTWARTGVETPQYPSKQARADGIEAGAKRPAAEHLADVADSAARLAGYAATMPAEAWLRTVRWTSGAEGRAAAVMWSRLREVEIHHVDLDAGYTPAQWPDSFTLRLLRGVAQDFGGRSNVPAMVIRCPEVGHDVLIAGDGSPCAVSGPAWAAAAWLIGRHDGSALTAAPPPLPALPAWS
jgi:maleylpyruvate isomerase